MFASILKNPKTSIPALIAAICQLLAVFGVVISQDVANAITTVAIVVIGLFARDGDKSSEDVGVK